MVAPLAALAVSAAGKIAKSLVGQAVAQDPKAQAQAKAHKTAQDFESMFLEQSLDRLVASSDTDGPLGENGAAGGVYRSMLAKEYAGAIAKGGGVGMADQVYRQILQMQESGHATGI